MTYILESFITKPITSNIKFLLYVEPQIIFLERFKLMHNFAY